MSIEDHLPSRQNPSPAQSGDDATLRSGKSPTGAVENRETSTDSSNKEIAKPAQIVNPPKSGKAEAASD